MSLIHCSECGHEVSTTAVACPNCARPLHAPPIVERKVIVAQPVTREGGFPTWALIPIGLLGVVLIFVMYIAFRGNDETANTNVNVNVAGRRPTAETRSTATSTVPASDATVVRPSSQTTTVPGSSTAQPVSPLPDKGSVTLNAKVTSNGGAVQMIKGTKFYLLEDDVETVLTEARIQPIEGNSLSASLGLAAVYPERYGEFQRSAVRAIAARAKYTGTTNATGGANLSGVDPKGYYIFGIARVGQGFALWNSPVSIVAGDNVLNLPQTVTNIPESNG